MAQLRCARTSELLLEGTPLEVVTAGGQFAAGEVIYDDVGPRFDPDAVRRAHADAVAGFKRALSDLPARAPSGATQADRDALSATRASLTATIAEREERVAAGKAAVQSARTRRDEALARVEERRRRDG